MFGIFSFRTTTLFLSVDNNGVYTLLYRQAFDLQEDAQWYTTSYKDHNVEFHAPDYRNYKYQVRTSSAKPTCIKVMEEINGYCEVYQSDQNKNAKVPCMCLGLSECSEIFKNVTDVSESVLHILQRSQMRSPYAQCIDISDMSPDDIHAMYVYAVKTNSIILQHAIKKFVYEMVKSSSIRYTQHFLYTFLHTAGTCGLLNIITLGTKQENTYDSIPWLSLLIGSLPMSIVLMRELIQQCKQFPRLDHLRITLLLRVIVREAEVNRLRCLASRRWSMHSL